MNTQRVAMVKKLAAENSCRSPHAYCCGVPQQAKLAREKLAADDARMKMLGEKQPALDFATPEQIGAAALFLCSQAAARIRGIAPPVDGGWTAQ